jgi:hypothetical protein
MVEPVQTVLLPVIGAGAAFTETTDTVLQPPSE